jgi:hypothetical protein
MRTAREPRTAATDVRQQRALYLRLSETEHAAVVQAATARGMRPLDFLRAVVRVAVGSIPVELRREPPHSA